MCSFPGPRAGWAFPGQKGERTVQAAESARAGVRLAACFLVQVNTSCNIWGNSTEYRRAPTEEDLSRTPQLVSVPMPGAPDEERGCLSSSTSSLSTGAYRSLSMSQPQTKRKQKRYFVSLVGSHLRGDTGLSVKKPGVEAGSTC